MNHVFVWTLDDVIGIALLVIIFGAIGVLTAYDTVRNWVRKRKKSK